MCDSYRVFQVFENFEENICLRVVFYTLFVLSGIISAPST